MGGRLYLSVSYNVMNLEYLFLCAILAVSVLAFVTITMQNVLSQIPETCLRALLITNSANRRILDGLDIEISYLYDNFGNRQDRGQNPNQPDMTV